MPVALHCSSGDSLASSAGQCSCVELGKQLFNELTIPLRSGSYCWHTCTAACNREEGCIKANAAGLITLAAQLVQCGAAYPGSQALWHIAAQRWVAIQHSAQRRAGFSPCWHLQPAQRGRRWLHPPLQRTSEHNPLQLASRRLTQTAIKGRHHRLPTPVECCQSGCSSASSCRAAGGGVPLNSRQGHARPMARPGCPAHISMRDGKASPPAHSGGRGPSRALFWRYRNCRRGKRPGPTQASAGRVPAGTIG